MYDDDDGIFGFDPDELVGTSGDAATADVSSEFTIMAVIYRAKKCWKAGSLLEACNLLKSVYTETKRDIPDSQKRSALYLLIDWYLKIDAIREAKSALDDLRALENNLVKGAASHRADYTILLNVLTVFYRIKTAGNAKQHEQLIKELSEVLYETNALVHEIGSDKPRRVFSGVLRFLEAEMRMLVQGDYERAIKQYVKAAEKLRVTDGRRLPAPGVDEADCLPDWIRNPDTLYNLAQLRELKARELSEGLEHYLQADQRYEVLRSHLVTHSEIYLSASLEHALLKYNAAQYSQAAKIILETMSLVEREQVFKESPPDVFLMANLNYVYALALEANNELVESEARFDECITRLNRAVGERTLMTGLGLSVQIGACRLLQTMGDYDTALKELDKFKDARLNEYPFPAILILAKLERVSILIHMRKSGHEVESALKDQLSALHNQQFVRKSHMIRGLVMTGLYNFSRKDVAKSLKAFIEALRRINPRNNIQYGLSIYLYSLAALAYAHLVNKIVDSASITFSNGQRIDSSEAELRSFKDTIERINQHIVEPFTTNYRADIGDFDYRLLRVWQFQVESYILTDDFKNANGKILQIQSLTSKKNVQFSVPDDLKAWLSYLKLQMLARYSLDAARRSPYYKEVTHLILSCEKSYLSSGSKPNSLLVSQQDIAYFFHNNESQLRDYCRDVQHHKQTNGLEAEAAINKFCVLYQSLCQDGHLIRAETISAREYEVIKKKLPLMPDIVARLKEPFSYAQRVDWKSTYIKHEVRKDAVTRPVLKPEERQAEEAKTMEWKPDKLHHMRLSDARYHEQRLLGQVITADVDEERSVVTVEQRVIEPNTVLWRWHDSITCCFGPPMQSVINEVIEERKGKVIAEPTRLYPQFDPCHIASGTSTLPIFADLELRILPAAQPSVSSVRGRLSTLRKMRTMRTMSLKNVAPDSRDLTGYFDFNRRLPPSLSLLEAVYDSLAVSFAQQRETRENGLDHFSAYLVNCLRNHVGKEIDQLIDSGVDLCDVESIISAIQKRATLHIEEQVIAMSLALRQPIIALTSSDSMVTQPKHPRLLDLMLDPSSAPLFESQQPIYLDAFDTEEGFYRVLRVHAGFDARETQGLPERLKENIRYLQREQQANRQREQARQLEEQKRIQQERQLQEQKRLAQEQAARAIDFLDDTLVGYLDVVEGGGGLTNPVFSGEEGNESLYQDVVPPQMPARDYGDNDDLYDLDEGPNDRIQEFGRDNGQLAGERFRLFPGQQPPRLPPIAPDHGLNTVATQGYNP